MRRSHYLHIIYFEAFNKQNQFSLIPSPFFISATQISQLRTKLIPANYSEHIYYSIPFPWRAGNSHLYCLFDLLNLDPPQVHVYLYIYRYSSFSFPLQTYISTHSRESWVLSSQWLTAISQQPHHHMNYHQHQAVWTTLLSMLLWGSYYSQLLLFLLFWWSPASNHSSYPCLDCLLQWQFQPSLITLLPSCKYIYTYIFHASSYVLFY